MSSPRSASIVITAVAVLALGGGLLAARRAWKPAGAPQSTMPAPQASAGSGSTADVDSSDRVIEQALGQIPAVDDSAAIKAHWEDEVGGIDASSLTPEQKEILVRVANSERCTCGCGFTLAACRRYDLTCPVSLPRVQALFDSVRTGKIRSAEGLRERPKPPSRSG